MQVSHACASEVAFACASETIPTNGCSLSLTLAPLLSLDGSGRGVRGPFRGCVANSSSMLSCLLVVNGRLHPDTSPDTDEDNTSALSDTGPVMILVDL